MSHRVALSHITRYDYARPASLGPQLIRLRPAPHNRTPVHNYSLKLAPQKHFINWQQDPHGNYVARVVMPEKVPCFEIRVDLVVDLETFNPFDFFLEPEAEKFPFVYAPALRTELDHYLQNGEATPKFVEFARTVDRTRRRTVDFLVDANRLVNQAVKYVIRMEPGVQTPEETLELGLGSCRDSAWLLVQLLRHFGIAARFVSGYLIQLKPDVVPIDGPPGPAEDFTDLHAWCECYLPGAGWVGVDPTSGLLAAEGHIPLACAPMPTSAAPIEGVTEKVETEFAFSMQVQRLHDVPRVTRPYTEEQWGEILALGNKVDSDLEAMDVRLTMGGEPTFVSAKEPDAPEWNTDALGGEKRVLADRLLRKLYPLWGKGGLLFHGQGKWYPGEQLPRWALGCFYRVDQVPLWHDPSLLARDDDPTEYDVEDAERFVQRLIYNLSLERHGLMPAYEDVWYYLWRARRLPTNVDPLDSRLDDPVEVERLARVFQHGLKRKVGWVLPLSGRGRGNWISGSWFLREEHCFLLPGDSPMGFRLPLDSLPWVAAEQREGVEGPDPSVERPALPVEFSFPLQRPHLSVRVMREQPRRSRSAEKEGENGEGKNREKLPSGAVRRTAEHPFSQPAEFESGTGLVRTALCVEPRAGRLHVFLPPFDNLEAFAELVAALEATAKDTKLRIQVEGYAPPKDARLGQFQITPDPGVIEVNVPPLRRFEDLVAQTQTLYQLAAEEKLIAEKFEIDGTHIGSGGGNHFVIGGATPEDSPFLRRPDLLASLLRFWNNHPGLSYLFCGRFIGPTSQSPRIDEARYEALYELDIAMQQLPAEGGYVPPWLVDRLFRHLLVDMTGNTHRTEFCIDKMFSPDSVSGRLGLVELRAFEMAPHPRMAAVQQLLIRALVAAFWRKPYTAPLVTWGTSLGDKFMLPYFIRQDLIDVLADLERWGYPLQYRWFEPQYEFRFPRYGEIVKDAIQLEVRGALEPWHVLGEEAAGGGQARFVDSSLERLQVKVTNIPGGRYAVCCQGVEVPLHPTGTQGEAVAGIRFRAWQPPSCLHPTIGVHAPLTFEIYDRWNRRAIAGCTYHVVHPGGLSMEQRPINATAAESRRIARFERSGHTVAGYEPRVGGVNPDFPLTLDLRRL